MDIFSQIEPLTAFLEKNKSLNKSVGFVPTMGALHNGHLALIANSRKENEASATDEFRILINQLSWNIEHHKCVTVAGNDIFLQKSKHR